MLPSVDADIAALEGVDLEALSDPELVGHLGKVEAVARTLAYPNIVVPLLFNAYARMLRRRLERKGVDAQAIDLGGGDPALADYDPKPSLEQLAAELDEVDAPTRERVLGGEIELLPEGPGFVDRFGHVSDSGNDFSSVPWRE